MSILQNKELIKKYEKEIFHFKHTALKTIENLESSLKDKLYLAHLFSDEEVVKKVYDEALKLIKAEQIISSESFDTFEEFHIESIDGDYQRLLKLITIKENFFSKGNNQNDSVKSEKSDHSLNSNVTNTEEREVKVVDKRKLEIEKVVSIAKIELNHYRKVRKEIENSFGASACGDRVLKMIDILEDLVKRYDEEMFYESE